jgi:ribosome silencing factor RsfS/YbeB/iojap
MNRERALSIVKEQLTEHRYIHTIGVMETAVELAKRYGADEKKAELAAIFHDYAKFRPKEEMKQIILQQRMPANLLTHNTELWHAPVGAYLVEKEAGITDAEVLNAIRYHTSGRPGMTLLEKIVYVADYIEPGRAFPGVEEVRELAKRDLDKALIQSLTNTISFLVKKNRAVYPDTIFTYNSLVAGGKKMEERKLLSMAVQAADDKRAEEMIVLNMKGISLIADYFLICHGNSDKQVQAIAREIKERANENNIPVKRLEGFDEARWILVDLGDVIVHVFHKDERSYYNLERLWGDAPGVNLEEVLNS